MWPFTSSRRRPNDCPAPPSEAAAAPAGDHRFEAFCHIEAPEVFSGVVWESQVWQKDHFDVPEIHAGARETFRAALRHANHAASQGHGQILLLKGEAGAGKTHLMRAFRGITHRGDNGYFAYMQMSTATSSYPRYLLHNLLDSLEKPYQPDGDGPTALMRLGTALVERPGVVPARMLTRLRESMLPPAELAGLVVQIADRLHAVPDLAMIDSQLLRAMVYLQTEDPLIRTRVMTILRCQALPSIDRVRVAALEPRTDEDDAVTTVVGLGRLVQALGRGALVICLDQMETIQNLDEPEVRFTRAIISGTALVERLPNLILVIACLEDMYVAYRQKLGPSFRHRIETEQPLPITLAAERTESELRSLIATRLHHLYQERGAHWDPAQPIYPFSDRFVADLAALQRPGRFAVNACRQAQEHARLTGTLPDLPALPGGIDRTPPTPAPAPSLPAHTASPETAPTPSPAAPLPAPGVGSPKPAAAAPPGPEAVIEDLEQLWNDDRSTGGGDVPDAEAGKAELLKSGLAACLEEVPAAAAWRISRAIPSGGLESLYVQGPNHTGRIWLCEARAQGGGLAKQLQCVLDHASGTVPMVARSTPFPKTRTAEASQLLTQICSNGGRAVVIEDADWRAMVAFQAFIDRWRAHPGLTEWRRSTRPLGQLPALAALLDLAGLLAARPAASPPAPVPASPADGTDGGAPAPAVPSAPVHPDGPDAHPSRPAPEPVGDDPGDQTPPLGVGAGAGQSAVTLRVEDLTRHAAFLGAPGSGKTCLALAVIENLLVRGIPAILIDRKGDLANYANPSAWTDVEGEAPARSAARRRLQEAADVHLFTPGRPEGRPLAVSLAPSGLGELTAADRRQVALQVAAGLCQMLSHRPATKSFTSTQSVLTLAVEVLAEHRRDPITLPDLIQTLSDGDPALTQRMGGLDPSLLRRVEQELETLRITKHTLFEENGERLDAAALLGHGRHAIPGKARLSIINLQFLPETSSVLFWMTQFLVEMGRYLLSHPLDRLQAVLFMDEADLYLPATSKPPTKPALETLLKRSRSAGLGLLLATQSPGDLDYTARDQITTWFLGKITQGPSLYKLKALLDASRVNPVRQLAGQKPGEFHLIQDGSVVRLRADRSLVPISQVPDAEILHLARARR